MELVYAPAGGARFSPIGTFRCPSDRFSQNWATCNYGTSLGPTHGWDPGNPAREPGFFQGGRETGFADVRDGLSNTIMLAEMLVPDAGPTDPYKSPQNYTHGCDGPLNDGSIPYIFPTQAQMDNWGLNVAVPAWNAWHVGDECCSVYANGLTTVVKTTVPPNWRYPDAGGGCGLPAGAGTRASRSRHPGGVNVALGDASIRFVSSTIDFPTWQNLGGRNEGIPVQVP